MYIKLYINYINYILIINILLYILYVYIYIYTYIYIYMCVYYARCLTKLNVHIIFETLKIVSKKGCKKNIYAS